MRAEAKPYHPRALMVAACARLIKDYERVFVGVGVSLLAGFVAQRVYAPNATVVYEGGGIGAVTKRMPWSISDNPTTDNALVATELWRVLGDTQRGFMDTAIIGAAQVDKFGNVNSSVMLGESYTYQRPRVRLPGSGGANDLASSCKRVIVLAALEKRRFVEKVDFITSPGFLDGPGAREKLCLRGGGPDAVVTNKCIFRFDSSTKEMFLAAVFPGVSIEEVKESVEWELRVAPWVEEVHLPTEAELQAMKIVDPLGIVLNPKEETLGVNFEEYYQKVKNAYESIELLL